MTNREAEGNKRLTDIVAKIVYEMKKRDCRILIIEDFNGTKEEELFLHLSGISNVYHQITTLVKVSPLKYFQIRKKYRNWPINIIIKINKKVKNQNPYYLSKKWVVNTMGEYYLDALKFFD